MDAPVKDEPVAANGLARQRTPGDPARAVTAARRARRPKGDAPDTSVAPKAAARPDPTRRSPARDHTKATLAQAKDAFYGRDWLLVVALLAPIEARLGKRASARLAHARRKALAED